MHPGERGFVTAAPGLGGITVYWDSGMERAVTDERMTRPVPPGEELKIFNGTPCLQLGDSQAEWDAHCEENARLVSAMEGFAERKGCMWAVKRTFLDDAHKSRSPRFELVDGGGLSALVEGCDAKNGMDVGFSAKRIAGARSMMMVAHGQGYRSPEHGDGIVEELIECRLVRRATSVLYQEKIDEGMSTRVSRGMDTASMRLRSAEMCTTSAVSERATETSSSPCEPSTLLFPARESVPRIRRLTARPS